MSVECTMFFRWEWLRLYAAGNCPTAGFLNEKWPPYPLRNPCRSQRGPNMSRPRLFQAGWHGCSLEEEFRQRNQTGNPDRNTQLDDFQRVSHFKSKKVINKWTIRSWIRFLQTLWAPHEALTCSNRIGSVRTKNRGQPWWKKTIMKVCACGII